jgi:hypothetical protein
VIRVQVSEENLIDLLLPNTGFGQPDGGDSSASRTAASPRQPRPGSMDHIFGCQLVVSS